MKRLMTLAVAGLLASPALGGDGMDPHHMANNSWITLSGTVKEVHPSTFVMNYGDGAITVEMDDGDRDADAYKLIPGDEVTVTGMIDDDFFEKTTIEAGTVHVKKLGTTFFSSAMDEEGTLFTSPYWTPMFSTWTSATYVVGKVTEVNGEEFVLDTGKRKLTVEVESMPYNPLDDEGYQKVEKGDRVSVTGTVDWDLFEGSELVAESIVVLHDARSGMDKDSSE